MALNDLISMMNAIANPQQAQGLALNLLAKRSPETADLIAKMIKSGESPTDALRKFAREGQISKAQLTQLKTLYKNAKRMGLKIDIPQSAWSEAEQALSTSPNTNTLTSDWF